MKLFRQLLGKKSEPESVETKIKKLEGQPQTALEAIISAERQDLEIRKSALELVSYGPFIEKLAVEDNQSSELQKLARQKIAASVDDNSLPPVDLLQSVKNTDALLAISSFCTKVDLETLVLAGIEDQTLLADLCNKASSSTVRQSLANRISDPELLRDLVKSLKHKDKKAYKIVKIKVDAIKEEEQKASEIEARLNELCSEIEQHRERHVDKDYVLKVDRLKRRWREVSDHASQTLKDQFQASFDVCNENIQSYEAEIKAAEEFKDKVSGAQSKRQALLGEVWLLICELYDCEKSDESILEKIREKSETFKLQWKELKQYGKPSSAESKDYTQMFDAIELVLKAYQEKGTIFESHAVVLKEDVEESEQKSHVKFLRSLLYPIQNLAQYGKPESVEKTIATLKLLDADYASSQEERQKQIRHIGGLLRKSSSAADQGRLRQAIGIRHSIDEKSKSIDSLPSHLTRQLEELDESIQKLVDWQAYAVVPKKHALVESMEKLVGLDVPPEALATKIKKLQDEWKSLSQSGKDRQEELWQKFSELADKAYEPCKIYYQNLAEKRKQNLEKRKMLVKQLEDFYRDYTWENADWKHVESILGTARSELHGYAPVDRAANKPVLDAFEKAISAIQKQLGEELDKNKAAKERLIEQAEKLSEISDLQQAIDGAKRLQMQWKSVGRCHYRDNDKLWKLFRRHCDAVFEKKQQKYEEQKAETDAIVVKAKEILAKLVAMIELPAEQLLSARSERDELQKEFFQLEGLPEKVQRGIERDLKKAMDRIDTKLSEVKRSKETNAWKDYFDACEKINDYCCDAQNAENIESLRTELDDFMTAVPRWPEGCLNVIKQKMATLSIDIQEDNIKALKLLCIRTEILSEKSTPEEDKALRMEYQVNMLKKGIGVIAQEENVAIKIAKEWGAVGPVALETYQSLFKRFYENWRQLSV